MPVFITAFAENTRDFGTGTTKKTGSDEHLRASVRRRKLFLLRSADRSADLRFAAFEVGLAAAAFLNLVKLLSHFNS